MVQTVDLARFAWDRGARTSLPSSPAQILRTFAALDVMMMSKSGMPGSVLSSGLGNLDEVVVVVDGDTDW